MYKYTFSQEFLGQLDQCVLNTFLKACDEMTDILPEQEQQSLQETVRKLHKHWKVGKIRNKMDIFVCLQSMSVLYIILGFILGFKHSLHLPDLKSNSPKMQSKHHFIPVELFLFVFSVLWNIHECNCIYSVFVRIFRQISPFTSCTWRWRWRGISWWPHCKSARQSWPGKTANWQA